MYREESVKAKAPAPPKPAADSGANWFDFGGEATKTAAGSGDNWASVFDSQPQTSAKAGDDGWSAAFSSQTTTSTTGKPAACSHRWAFLLC